MSIRAHYIKSIKSNCAVSESAVQDVAYWRNNLFAGTIIYLFPFCLISLIPSLYWVIINGQYIIAVADTVTVVSLVGVAFIPDLAVNARKIIFMLCVYIFSCIMLYNIGLIGPGLIYLLIACILCTLIFPARYAWWAALLNTLICTLFVWAVSLKLLPLPANGDNTIGVWIVVCSNLVFLSFLSAALIPRVFTGLQHTIEKETELQVQLNREKKALNKALEMLEEKNSDLEQFAYTASHDLQEPLRMVSGFLTLLEERYKSLIDDKGKKYIHFAVDGAQRMRQIILDLLEFSRAGRVDDSGAENVDLNELFHEIRVLFSKQIEEKQAILYTENFPVIYTHKSMLKQIFQNLISNALKYGKDNEPVKINVTVKETQTQWQFSVADNGIGIAEKYFDKIFVIFQRLHDREKYTGTGIGLAICKKTIERRGGNIRLESQEGAGSTFYFTVIKQNNLSI